jgi:hypothetical protein
VKPSEFARLSTELGDLFDTHPSKFCSSIKELRLRINITRSRPVMHRSSGTPSANAEQGNNQAPAMPQPFGHQPFLQAPATPQPFGHQGPQFFHEQCPPTPLPSTPTLPMLPIYGQPTPVATATLATPFHQRHAAQANPVAMPDFGKSPSEMRPTECVRFRDIVAPECVLSGIAYADEACKGLLTEADVDQLERDAEVSRLNALIANLHAEEELVLKVSADSQRMVA